MNIVDMISEKLNSMTKSEARVGSYCLVSLSDVAFGTLDGVAENVGVSTTSVIRFCRKLGFSGFGEFQDAVRRGFRYQPSLPDKFLRAADSITDALSSSVVIAGAVIGSFLPSGIPLDAIMGILISLLILKAGFSIARETVDRLLGAPADAETSACLRQIILSGINVCFEIT